MKKLLIFDWDDVVTLGSKEGYYACYRETLNELGIIFPENELHRRIQKRWGQPFHEELKELLLEKPELIDNADKIFEQKFWGDIFVRELYEVNGANELLTYLHSKYTLAVATGNHPDMLRKKIFPLFKIPDVFTQIITSYDVPPEKTKPHPFMLEQIMKTQNVTPSETLYIGDAENDARMAQSAGVEPVTVLTGHLNRHQAEQLGVTLILPDITHLKKIL
jgi:phosphoglycolate phosphatase